MSTITADRTATVPVPPELLPRLRRAITGEIDGAGSALIRGAAEDGDEQAAVDLALHIIEVRASMLGDHDEYPAGSVRAAAGWALEWQVNALLEGDSLTLDEAEELVRLGRALEALIATAA